MDALLLPDEKVYRTPFNLLKQPPKKPSPKNLQELLRQLNWLRNLGDFREVIKDIPTQKIRHFAGEAKSLDAGEMKKFSAPKRYALLVCSVDRALVNTRDALGQMFVRQIAKLHQEGKKSLQVIQIKHLEKANDWLQSFREFCRQLIWSSPMRMSVRN